MGSTYGYKYKYTFCSTYGYLSKGLSSVTPTRDLNNYKSETSISISLIYMSFRRSGYIYEESK